MWDSRRDTAAYTREIATEVLTAADVCRIAAGIHPAAYTGEIATEILTATDVCGIAAGTQLHTQER